VEPVPVGATVWYTSPENVVDEAEVMRSQLILNGDVEYDLLLADGAVNYRKKVQDVRSEDIAEQSREATVVGRVGGGKSLLGKNVVFRYRPGAWESMVNDCSALDGQTAQIVSIFRPRSSRADEALRFVLEFNDPDEVLECIEEDFDLAFVAIPTDALSRVTF
jgi:hypothetical protein